MSKIMSKYKCQRKRDTNENVVRGIKDKKKPSRK